MMQKSDNPEVNEAGASKASTVDYISGAKIVEGITTSVTNFTENLSKGITNVDNVMQSFVNQMGQGQGLSEGIRREFAGAAEEVIKLGGTQQDAADIQTKTLEVLGRNVLLSKDQSKELFAATKISGVEIDRLEKGFINAGKSIKDIGKEMLMVREVANNMGVNAKAVSDTVVKNLDKLNRYGFQNGVEGLAKMAANSQGLGVSMEQTLEFADQLSTPEKAMETAAFFQRIGAQSESLKNPLKLLDLQMNDVEALQDELGKTYAKFTDYNKETGEATILKNARGIIREIVAETGQSREYVEQMALSYRKMGEKMKEISFAGFDVDEDTKKLIANAAEMGTGGEYTVKVKQVDDKGKETLVEKSIQQLLTQTQGNKDELKMLLGSEEPESKKTIEQIAEEQLSYAQKIDANIKLLVEQPGLTAGASKAGKQLLEGTYEATKAVNQPFQKRLDSDSKIAESLDTFGTKIKEGITSLQEGRGYQDLLNAFKNQGAEFGKTVATELTAGGIEVLAKLGDLTGLKSVFDELKLTDDVKEILEEIKKEGGDLSEETIKMIDETLDKINEINKKEPNPPVEPDNEPKPPVEPDNEPKPPVEPDKEPDTEKAKETIDKITKKSGEIYDSIKETIFEIFKEITTERIDVNELNVIGETKNNLEQKTSVEEISQVGQTIENVTEINQTETQQTTNLGNQTNFNVLNEVFNTTNEELKDISVTNSSLLKTSTEAFDKSQSLITNTNAILSSIQQSSTLVKTNNTVASTTTTTTISPTTAAAATTTEPTVTKPETPKAEETKETKIEVKKASKEDVGLFGQSPLITSPLKIKEEEEIEKRTEFVTKLTASEIKNYEEKKKEQVTFTDFLNKENEIRQESTKISVNEQTINSDSKNKQIVDEQSVNTLVSQRQEFVTKLSEQEILSGKDITNQLSERTEFVTKLSEQEINNLNRQKEEQSTFVDFLNQENITREQNQKNINSQNLVSSNELREQSSIQTELNNQTSTRKDLVTMMSTKELQTFEDKKTQQGISLNFLNKENDVRRETLKDIQKQKTTSLDNQTQEFIFGQELNEQIIERDNYVTQFTEEEIRRLDKKRENELSFNNLFNQETVKREQSQKNIINQSLTDLDLKKQQISIENALLIEKEKKNVETISNFKESDFDKRVRESEILISALDKEIEKQKNVESTVDSTKTLTEQMSNLYKEENFLTVTEPITAVENETEPNVVNASPIQPTIAPIELTNKNVKPEELSTKVQDFLANQPKQEDKVGSNEPIKIETKFTIDGDPRFASLLDPRQFQKKLEDELKRIVTTKTDVAQVINRATSLKAASMDMRA